MGQIYERSYAPFSMYDVCSFLSFCYDGVFAHASISLFYLLSISLFLFLLNYDVCDVLGNKCAWFQRAS